MTKVKHAIILFAVALFHNNSYSQFDVGIKPIITDEVYAIHSEMYDGASLLNTANIFLFKGVDETVWIFGTGYGEPEDIRFYKNNNNITTSGSDSDANLIDSVIQHHFNLSNINAKLQFIVPHFHLDHINQELITALESFENYDLTNSKIYVHTNDFSGATCNSACCADIPCDPSSSNHGAPYDFAWNLTTLSKFISLGQPSDICNQVLMNFQTSYGSWEIAKADIQHTLGALNIFNTNLKLKILGSAPGTQCTTPNDWQLLRAHGNLNLDSVIVLELNEMKDNSNSIFKIYPNPSSENVTFELASQKSFLSGTLIIYSITGQKTMEIEVLSNKISRVFNLKTGVYFVKLVDDKGTVVSIKRLIIE